MCYVTLGGSLPALSHSRRRRGTTCSAERTLYCTLQNYLSVFARPHHPLCKRSVSIACLPSNEDGRRKEEGRKDGREMEARLGPDDCAGH